MPFALNYSGVANGNGTAAEENCLFRVIASGVKLWKGRKRHNYIFNRVHNDESAFVTNNNFFTNVTVYLNCRLCLLNVGEDV